MNRSTFFKSLAAGTIGLPLFLRMIGGGQSHAQADRPTQNGEVFNWKMVTTWPPGFPVLGEGCQLLADMCRTMSGGRLNITVYGGGELVPALEAFDAVRQGAAEVGSGCSYYWAGKAPAAQFFAGFPNCGGSSMQTITWYPSPAGIPVYRWGDGLTGRSTP